MIESNILRNLNPIYLLYFFYGLAFLFLGAAISIRDMRDSRLKLAGSLWLLSGFGFTHGFHEWIELFLLMQGEILTRFEFRLVKTFALTIVHLSFLSLLLFGLSLTYSINKHPLLKGMGVGAILFFPPFIYYLWSGELSEDPQFFDTIDALSRLTYCLFGALITAYGLVLYSQKAKKISESTAKYIFYTGIGFLFYSLFAALIPSHSKMPVFPIPVELFRGISAVFITYFLFKGLNIFDIETRKKLEEQITRAAQTEKMASLGRMAAGIAHEINTPLTNASLKIQLSLSQKGENSLNQNLSDKLVAVEKNIDRASGIARELLQFSHQKESNFLEIDIKQVIESALTLLQYRMKNIDLQLNLSETPSIIGSETKLEQVFINTIGNSIEAMPDGGVIKISTTMQEKTIRIEIEDTGSGISEPDKLKIFDPFFTTKKIGQGTGLGLSICYGIIEQHKGTISLGSANEKGTVVIIDLPILQFD
ncbi:MAG: GHKL domain-containing protein [Proteobacteria bacterium]|nr:GHKL domain-containing protein [Pseudomonadota bacterium]